MRSGGIQGDMAEPRPSVRKPRPLTEDAPLAPPRGGSPAPPLRRKPCFAPPKKEAPPLASCRGSPASQGSRKMLRLTPWPVKDSASPRLASPILLEEAPLFPQREPLPASHATGHDRLAFFVSGRELGTSFFPFAEVVPYLGRRRVSPSMWKRKTYLPACHCCGPKGL